MYRVKKAIHVWMALALVLVLFIPRVAFADEEQQALNYVALGDSLAAGVQYNNELGNGYPVYIQQDLAELTEGEVTLVNKGVPGYRTDQVLQQINDPEVLGELATADVVTLGAGANDLLQAVNIGEVDFTDPEQVEEVQRIAEEEILEIGQNTAAILGTIREVNPDALIYVMGYYNALPYMDPSVQPYILNLIAGLNQGIQGGAAPFNGTFVPTFHAFEGNYESYLPNPTNIHPNEAGYQAIAGEFMLAMSADLEPVEEPEPEVPGHIVITDEQVQEVIGSEFPILFVALDEEVDTNEIRMNAEQFNILADHNVNMVVESSAINLMLPVTSLGMEATESVVISIDKLGNVDNSLSPVFDIGVQVDGNAVTDIEEAYLGLAVNQEEINNLEDVKPYTYNEETGEWEALEEFQYDEMYGLIAPIHHFGKYVVLEMVEEDNETEEPGEDQDSGEDQEPGENQEAEEDPSDSEDKPTQPEDESDEEEQKESPAANDDDDETKQEGKQLPDTATNTHNMLLIGGLLLVAGTGFYLLSRRKLA